ncbi:MAG: alpha/beta hydrolase, partial [Bacillota bacterium]|nr:alpha/beta hydrolase [Bacillota bacterium]
GCDFLGHGLSTDTNAYVHYADKHGDELAYESVTLVQAYIKEHYPTLPVFVLGHSMGSFLARLAILKNPDFYEKAVISGTGMHPKPLILVGMALCNIIGCFRGPKYVSPLIQKMSIDSCPAQMRKDGIIKDRDVEWLTKDVEIQNYYFQSPMCGQPATIAANRDMFKWLLVINNKKNLAKGNKQMPIFLISGQNDAVSNYGKTVEQLAGVLLDLGYQHVSLKLYEGDRHEILNELDKAVVYQDIIDFLEK